MSTEQETRELALANYVEFVKVHKSKLNQTDLCLFEICLNTFSMVIKTSPEQDTWTLEQILQYYAFAKAIIEAYSRKLCCNDFLDKLALEKGVIFAAKHDYGQTTQSAETPRTIDFGEDPT